MEESGIRRSVLDAIANVTTATCMSGGLQTPLDFVTLTKVGIGTVAHYSGTCDGYAYPQKTGLLSSKRVKHFTFIPCSISYYVLFFTSSTLIIVGAR